MIENKMARYYTNDRVFSNYVISRDAMKRLHVKEHYLYFLEETVKLLRYNMVNVRKGIDIKGYYQRKYSWRHKLYDRLILQQMNIPE